MNSFVLIATLLAGIAAAAEINIIYPRPADSTKPYEFSAGMDSSFVLGNIKPTNSQLSINGTPILTHSNGAFLAFLPLQVTDETNSWNFVLIEKGGAEIARRSFQYSYRSQNMSDTVKKEPHKQTLTVIAPNAHTRTFPQGSYEFFPVVGTEIAGSFVEGNPFCQLDFGGAVEAKFVEISPPGDLPPVRIGNGKSFDYEDSSGCIFSMSRTAVVRPELSDERDHLDVWVADAQAGIDRMRYHNVDSYVKNVDWSREDGGTNLAFELRAPLKRGYHVEPRDNNLTVTFYPNFGGSKGSLKGKTIVVDAGHGGSAAGAIGPLGTREKDVTLRWSKLLEHELTNKGANVVQTRTEDIDLSLYDRIDKGRTVQADFFVSLHANALPDGENPANRKGCGVYYYQPASREAAEIMQKQLLDATGLQNDGIFDANFAVIRPTEFPALLIEGAYLMHPEEEQLLLQDEFLSKMSKAIVRGLSDFYKAAR